MPVLKGHGDNVIQSEASPDAMTTAAEAQWLFTDHDLLRTPSILDGLAPEKEREYRSKGVNFALQAGIMLKLPQITLATASIFFHRFFMRHSMQSEVNKGGYHHYSIAATSLFLATKVEENCRKMKDLVVACVRVAQKDPYRIVDEQDKEYWRWRDNILVNEDVLLEALCFDLRLEPPYKFLYEMLSHFDEAENKRLRNAAWAFINDSCLTTLCLLFSSRVIAASALYAASKYVDVALARESEEPWWDSVNVDLSSIKGACGHMQDIYHAKIDDEGTMVADGIAGHTPVAHSTRKDLPSPLDSSSDQMKMNGIS